jgi:hypothetical protein
VTLDLVPAYLALFWTTSVTFSQPGQSGTLSFQLAVKGPGAQSPQTGGTLRAGARYKVSAQVEDPAIVQLTSAAEQTIEPGGAGVSFNLKSLKPGATRLQVTPGEGLQTLMPSVPLTVSGWDFGYQSTGTPVRFLRSAMRFYAQPNAHR